jgi:hypothetical protein
MAQSKMSLLYIVQSRVKRFLGNCYNKNLIRAVFRNFSFLGNAAIFSSEDVDMSLQNVILYLRVYTELQPKITS